MKTIIPIPIGTILVQSIGCGCNEFYQVIDATAKSVVVRELECKIINHKPKYQTFDYLPIPNKFASKETQRLRLALDTDTNGNPTIRIGPIKRMIWWSVWKGDAKPQWSS